MKCDLYRQCTEWEQDGLKCSFFYYFCRIRNRPRYEQERQRIEALRQLPEARRTKGLDSFADTPDREGVEI